MSLGGLESEVAFEEDFEMRLLLGALALLYLGSFIPLLKWLAG